MKTVYLLLTLMLASANTLRAGDAPLGHKDYYPSDERPVGWRGDGNGWYAGATPVTRWQTATVEGGRSWTTINEERNNIVWEVTPPGWCSSSPIIVGDRVFATCNPDVLLCLDMADGKIRWQRTHSPFAIDGKPAEEVAKLDELHSLASALVYLYGFATCRDKDYLKGLTAISDPQAYALERMQAFRPRVQELDPTLLPALDQDLAALQGGKLKDSKDCTLWLRGKEGFAAAFEAKHDVVAMFEFHDNTGFAMPTPVSDGRHVYVSFANGQTACYDLNGKRVWWKRFPRAAGSVTRWGNEFGFVASPHLIGDLLIVPYKAIVRALDKRTGEVRWERSDPVLCDAKHVRLPQGEAMVDVLVWPSKGSQGNVWRASDGTSIGDGPVAFRMAVTGRDGVVFGWGERTFAIQHLAIGADGRVVSKKRVPFAGKKKVGALGYRTPTTSDRLEIIDNGIWDITTGAKLAQIEGVRRSGHESCILLGDILVVPAGERGHYGGPKPKPPRGKEYGIYATVDLSDPSAPKVLAQNVLGGERKPRMPDMERWLPELYEGGFYHYWGIPYKFAPYYSGSIAASGNRIVIMTECRIYCIGDPSVPYDWNPASRPAEVTATLEERHTK